MTNTEGVENYMSIQEILKNEYDVCEILELQDMSKSSPCYQIVTAETSYVLKQVERLDFLKTYHKVQNVLNNQGLLQGRLIPTRENELMSKTGYSLIEYVPGEALEEYNDEQFISIIKYLYKYNQILREVPFEANEIEEVNNWDKVKSVVFICHKVEEILNEFELEEKSKFLLKNAKKVLSDHADYFNRNNKQLIHSDLGPGNIVFCNNKIQTIIDFTPEYENELYSLSQFLYWTCLWDFSESTSLDRIRSTLKIYFNEDVPQEIYEGLFLYLLKACMFRIMGPILNDTHNGVLNMSKVKKRMSALESLFNIRQKIK
ncbi:phosphotransferase [Paenibacillus sp. LMG 31456]|uniref:Phosphotransferase n=1 Tax=Paenibacillus foliorum TaxID=2654974 RepID=A0A972GV18_9BACL|nr:phosphotransferase [Paenibacillus foliorum]NOU94337.1 phosphotransferase [Paenibacillus foliorum]